MPHVDPIHSLMPTPAQEASLAVLAARLLRAVLQLQWWHASRVLSVGDGLVH